VLWYSTNSFCNESKYLSERYF